VIILYYVILYYIILCYVTLRYTTLRYATLRYVPLCYVTLIYVLNTVPLLKLAWLLLKNYTQIVRLATFLRLEGMLY
jgi:hypothetical protein